MSSSRAIPQTKDPDEVQGRKRTDSLHAKLPNMSLRRMVLVGKTGAGKSSSGNTILGRKAFRAARKASSVTKECWKETGKVAGHQLELVDCPGIFDTSLSKSEFINEMSKCVNMMAPGPHAIILVIQFGPFTEEERCSVERLRDIFGKEADKHTIILFTHGDELSEDTGQDLTDHIKLALEEAGPDLKALTESYGERYHVFNNTKMDDRKQVLDFLDKVDDMLRKNGDQCYTSEMFERAEKKLKDEEEGLEKKCSEMMQKLIDTFNEEKTKLEEDIRQLKQSGQTKDQRIKELEEKLKNKDRHFKESMRFYELKRKNARQEVEEMHLKENFPEISRKLQKLHV